MRVLRRALWLTAALWWASTLPAAHAQQDPRLRWTTLQTRHFRVHFHQGLDRVARRAAEIAESSFARLTPRLGWEPREPIQLVLSDPTDSANGVASATPYNSMHLFVTAPGDLSPLGDFEDWLTELVSHELTHVLHLDHVAGLPAVVNTVFGKVLTPAQYYPRWFLEGLAVVEESRRTSGGRLRSTMFDMWLRMDALENHWLQLDQITSDPRRFPHGHVRYLYGSRFVGWIVDHFGEDALEHVVRDSSRQLIPYGINRTLLRATGYDYPTLYRRFTRDMRRRYRRQAAAIRGAGETPVRFVTDGCETVASPRWSGDGQWLYFQLADQHERAAVARIPADGRSHSSAELERLFQVNGDMLNSNVGLAFDPGGTSLVYSHSIPWRDVYVWNDLVRFDLGRREHTRLTHGARAASPDVARDGRIAYLVNAAGTTHLMVSDREGRSPRFVVRSRSLEQVYSPRWSPDGRHIAYASWSAGGFRDIAIVEVATGRIRRVTHDRAVESGPAWSPDGARLYFASDRTGVSNVHAWDVATGVLRQITNVVSGAYSPEPSPDGRMLAMVVYRAGGFDLATMPVDEARFRPAAPAPPDRRPGEIRPRAIEARRRSYNPLETLAPRSWSLGTTQNSFGHGTIEVATSGEDVVGLHAFEIEARIDPRRGDLDYELAYAFRGSNPTFSVTHGRVVAPRSGFGYDGVRYPWVEERHGLDVSTTYQLNRNFQDHSLSLSYSASHTRATEEPEPTYDPSGHPPSPPLTGWLASVGVGWSFTNVQSETYAISSERGRRLGIGADVGLPQVGSEERFVELRASWAEFVPMPFRHHVLALRAAAGIGASESNRRGLFSLAGFVSQNPIEAVARGYRAPSAVLRGFVPYSRTGDRFHLYNAEYRFPLFDVDRGILTFPIVLNRVFGIGFVDFGDAFFGEAEPAEWNLGVGGELIVQATFGYYLEATFRIGVARGLTERGITDYYLVVGEPF